MATTFETLYTDVMNRFGAPVTDTVMLAKVKRILNQISRDIALQRPWRDLQRRSTLTLYLPVTTGYVDVTNASTAVSGGTTSPTFVTNAVAANMKIKFANRDEVYTVSAVGSETGLTLTAAYQGATDTDVTYKIWKDEYALASDFARPVDYVSFLDHRKIIHMGLREMRERFPWPTVPATPKYYTLVKPATGDQRVWNVLFYPPPAEAEMLPYEYISSYMAYTTAGAGQAEMSATTDEPWMDERYRHVLVWGTLGELYRDYKDDTRSTEVMSLYQDMIRRMANDEEPTQDRPRFLPNTSRWLRMREAKRTPRYDVNGRFDRME